MPTKYGQGRGRDIVLGGKYLPKNKTYSSQCDNHLTEAQKNKTIIKEKS